MDLTNSILKYFWLVTKYFHGFHGAVIWSNNWIYLYRLFYNSAWIHPIYRNFKEFTLRLTWWMVPFERLYYFVWITHQTTTTHQVNPLKIILLCFRPIWRLKFGMKSSLMTRNFKYTPARKKGKYNSLKIVWLLKTFMMAMELF